MNFGPLFHSVLLAQTIGLYLIIASIVSAAKAKYFREVISRLEPYNPAILVAASVGLMIGCFIIIIHNLWVWEPRVVVTIIGWIILIKSIIWLSFPVRVLNWCKKLYLSPGYYVVCACMFIVGVYLATRGFYLYIPAEHLQYTIF